MDETPDLAWYVGREVCDASDGVLLGPVEGTRHLAYDGQVPPEIDVLMVRHIHGDGQLRAYEMHEVREHIAEGRIVPAPGYGLPAGGQDPEADGPEAGD